MGAIITGWGTALPEKTVTNYDLSARMETSHDWIVERTGIHERHVGGTTQSLAVEAGRQAIERSGLQLSEIDLLILATTTPDQTVPATSAGVQHELGLPNCGAFDLNAACSGFVYGLVAAHGYIACGAKNVLLVGAETLSRIVDWDDRGTAILFGDGAGACVIEAVEGPGQLVSWDVGADGTYASILYADVGATLHMDGKEVFRRAVRVMVDSGNKALAAAGITADDLDLVVPHQANTRIIESALNKLNIPMEKASLVLEHTGNTSSASIPLALVDAIEKGRVKEGDLVLLVGFGAGMTVASAVLRWGVR